MRDQVFRLIFVEGQTCVYMLYRRVEGHFWFYARNLRVECFTYMVFSFLFGFCWVIESCISPFIVYCPDTVSFFAIWAIPSPKKLVLYCTILHAKNWSNPTCYCSGINVNLYSTVFQVSFCASIMMLRHFAWRVDVIESESYCLAFLKTF